jgi:hypothetical protein
MGVDIGFYPSNVPAASNARIPPILVPPMQSNILCKGYPTLLTRYSSYVAKSIPRIPPPSMLKPIL